MITIKTARCVADEADMKPFEICRNGQEYRVIALTKADAEAALDDHLAEPMDDVAGELPSLFEL
jgi:hypothetical protein